MKVVINGSARRNNHVHPEQVPHNLRSFGARVPMFGIAYLGTNNARLLRMTKVRHAPKDELNILRLRLAHHEQHL